MKVLRPDRFLLLPLLLVLPLSGCLLRSHRVTARVSSTHLQTATKQELVDRVNAIAHRIQTLNATVDIASSVGGEKTGKVTEYQEIRGFILVRQPRLLRMIGLMPVVRNHAFDMVSDGPQFRLWIPPKNKFYVGQNNYVPPGTTGMLALRPQIIYDSLLLDGIDPKDQIAIMESGTEQVVDPQTHKEVSQPDYRLLVLQRNADEWYLARKIYFSRVDLQPRRQTMFDANSNITTKTLYDGWKEYGDVWFPSVIEISRPIEEYDITIGLVKLTLNSPLTDQQFALSAPIGAEIVQLNGAPAASDGTK